MFIITALSIFNTLKDINSSCYNYKKYQSYNLKWISLFFEQKLKNLVFAFYAYGTFTSMHGIHSPYLENTLGYVRTMELMFIKSVGSNIKKQIWLTIHSCTMNDGLQI